MSMMVSKQAVLGVALAACLLALAAQSVAGQAAAGASAGSANGAVAAASAGKVPAASLAGQCTSFASVSPWDAGSRFPNIVLCCGGSIGFQWSGLSSVWQISSRTCPTAFRNTTTTKQLIPQSQGSGRVKSLYLPIPGTYYFTSATPGACSGGLIFAAQVPPGSGTVCPATLAARPTPAPTAAPAKPTPAPTAAPTPAPSAPNAQAAAVGPPGGTSTSTAPGAAAAASGPPGTSRTATAPGMSFSSAGNFGRKLKALVTGMAA